jgi:hypothetical protein
MKAINAKNSVMLLRVIVIDVTFNPMGVSPRNNPVIPTIPKLNATLNTTFSIISILFFSLKSIFTKQLPGMKNTKTMAST